MILFWYISLAHIQSTVKLSQNVMWSFLSGSWISETKLWENLVTHRLRNAGLHDIMVFFQKSDLTMINCVNWHTEFSDHFSFKQFKLDVNKVEFSFSPLFLIKVNPVKRVIPFKVNSTLLVIDLSKIERLSFGKLRHRQTKERRFTRY